MADSPIVTDLAKVERYLDEMAMRAAAEYNRRLPRESKRWKDEHENCLYYAGIARRAAVLLRQSISASSDRTRGVDTIWQSRSTSTN